MKRSDRMSLSIMKSISITISLSFSILEPIHLCAKTKVNNDKTTLGKSNLGTNNLIYISPNLNCSKERFVTKYKFLCQMHSEAKGTEMLESGAQKGVLQG